MEEIWKPVKGFEDSYEVSNQGRVRSIARDTVVHNVTRWSGSGRVNSKDSDETWHRPGRVLKPLNTTTKTNINKCLTVRLYKSDGSGRKAVMVKSLVVEAFVTSDSIPARWIQHKDGDSTNCAVDNLVISRQKLKRKESKDE